MFEKITVRRRLTAQSKDPRTASVDRQRRVVFALVKDDGVAKRPVRGCRARQSALTLSKR